MGPNFFEQPPLVSRGVVLRRDVGSEAFSPKRKVKSMLARTGGVIFDFFGFSGSGLGVRV